MYIIEVFERKKWRLLKNSINTTKNDLEKEVEELNSLVPKEYLKFLPVKEKYRVRKIKNSQGKQIQEELLEKKRQKELVQELP